MTMYDVIASDSQLEGIGQTAKILAAPLCVEFFGRQDFKISFNLTRSSRPYVQLVNKGVLTIGCPPDALPAEIAFVIAQSIAFLQSRPDSLIFHSVSFTYNGQTALIIAPSLSGKTGMLDLAMKTGARAISTNQSIVTFYNNKWCISGGSTTITRRTSAGNDVFGLTYGGEIQKPDNPVTLNKVILYSVWTEAPRKRKLESGAISLLPNADELIRIPAIMARSVVDFPKDFSHSWNKVISACYKLSDAVSVEQISGEPSESLRSILVELDDK